jgi:hypothetical protein
MNDLNMGSSTSSTWRRQFLKCASAIAKMFQSESLAVNGKHAQAEDNEGLNASNHVLGNLKASFQAFSTGS